MFIAFPTSTTIDPKAHVRFSINSSISAISVLTQDGKVVTVNAPRAVFQRADGTVTVAGTDPADTVCGTKGITALFDDKGVLLPFG